MHDSVIRHTAFGKYCFTKLGRSSHFDQFHDENLKRTCVPLTTDLIRRLYEVLGKVLKSLFFETSLLLETFLRWQQRPPIITWCGEFSLFLLEKIAVK